MVAIFTINLFFLSSMWINGSLLPQEFELWKGSLAKDKQEDATGFFSVIRRHGEFMLDASLSNNTIEGTDDLVGSTHDLYSIPFSQEYKPFLKKAAELLHKAGDLTDSPRYNFC